MTAADKKMTLRVQASHRHMSLAFLIVWLVLVGFGLLMMFSASYGISFVQSSAEIRSQLTESGALDANSPVRAVLAADASALARKQAAYTLLGTIAAVTLGAVIHFRQLTRPVFPWLVYTLLLGSLIYCRLFGLSLNGARRWVSLGFVTFQPSELAKVGGVFFLASYLSRRRRLRARDKARPEGQRKSLASQAFKDVTWPAMLMMVLVVLILIQPHLSGAVILTLITITVFLLADIPWKSMAAGLVQLLVIVLVAALLFSAGYQMLTKKSATDFIGDRFAHVFRRVGTFQDRDTASDDDRMQIEQAELALGSGGLTGKGLGKSVQKLNWLSEAHNDFILPVIGEELGFIGVSAVILLFLAFLAAGIMVARRASTHMGMLIAAGNTILIVLQAFLNMAVAASLIPTTGISLPFFSYGGTANIFFALAAGMVLCVSKSGVATDPEIARIVDRGQRKKARGKKTVEEDDSMRYAV